jgi:predicted GH43/DUF377 family glycosyl hydrolase
VIIPGANNKDAMIFPEPIKKKVILIHRIEPNIQFAYFDTIELMLSDDENYWENYLKRIDELTIMRPEFDCVYSKIGAEAPPIKTARGWLMIYHGLDKNLVYGACAALLDLKNPMKVIGRAATISHSGCRTNIRSERRRT